MPNLLPAPPADTPAPAPAPTSAPSPAPTPAPTPTTTNPPPPPTEAPTTAAPAATPAPTTAAPAATPAPAAVTPAEAPKTAAPAATPAPTTAAPAAAPEAATTVAAAGPAVPAATTAAGKGGAAPAPPAGEVPAEGGEEEAAGELVVPTFLEGVVGDELPYYKRNRKQKTSAAPRLNPPPVVGYSTRPSSTKSRVTTPRDVEHVDPREQATTKKNSKARIPRQVVEDVEVETEESTTHEEEALTFEPENVILADDIGFSPELPVVVSTAATQPTSTTFPPPPLIVEEVPPKIDEYCLECDDSPPHAASQCDFNDGAFINA